MTYMSRNPQVASVVLDDITTTTPANPPSGKVKVVDRNGTLFVRNSSGAESAIGTNSSVGSGEKNYVENPSAAASISGWTAAGNLDAVRTATAADLPRENTTKTGIKITSKSPVASGSSDRVYYDVNLDDVDASGRIMKLKWDQKTTGTYTAGQLEVVITTQADRATAIATPFTSAIPASDGTFQTYFLAPSTSTCSVVIRATTSMTASGGIVISDVVVGPNVQVQGAAIGAWKSYTPTLVNGGTVSSSNVLYREVGSNLEIIGRWAFSGAGAASIFRIPLPAGFTADITKISVSGVNPLGEAILYKTTSEPSYSVQYISSTEVGLINYTDSNWINGNALANGYALGVRFTIPVNELSSNVTLANRAVEEFASNSNATNTASDTTSFAYGPGGSLVPNGAVGTTYTRRVRFSSPIQATDLIRVEFKRVGGNWIEAAAEGWAAVVANTIYYGVTTTNVAGNTDLDISFSSGGSSPLNAATYAANGSAWSGLYAANIVWRVRKVSGGASVGYPISSANIVGRTDGVAPASWMVGEQISNAPSDTATNTSTPTVVGTITLTPGCWSVSATSYCRGAASQTGATHALNVLGSSGATNAVNNVAQTNAATGSHAVTFNPRIVNVSESTATKTITVTQLSTTAAGIGLAYITAIRIA